MYYRYDQVIKRDKNKLLMIALAVGFAAALTLGVFGIANAATPTVVVTPSTLALPISPTTITDSWYFYDDTVNAASASESSGSYEFTTGPSVPPLGNGSVSFELTAGNERRNIATNQFAGSNLADWSALSFDMYTPATSTGGTSTTLFLNFDVDFNTSVSGTGFAAQDAPGVLPFFPYQHRLVYVPQQNGSPNLDTWETWNAGADDASWTWSRFVANGNKWPDGNTNQYRTFDDIKTAFPNIGVYNETGAGQFLVRAGHPGPVGLQGSVDNIVVGDTAFDFEPVVTLADKNACKKGGWMTSNTPVFKNQGECVSSFAKVTNNGRNN